MTKTQNFRIELPSKKHKRTNLQITLFKGLNRLLIMLLIVSNSRQNTVQYTYYNGEGIPPAVIRDETTLFDQEITNESDIEIEVNSFMTHIPILASGEEFKIRIEVADRGASFIMCGATEGARMTVDGLDPSGDTLIIEGSFVDIEGGRMNENIHVVEKLFSGPG